MIKPIIDEWLAEQIKERIWHYFVQSNLPEDARNAIKLACEAVDSFKYNEGAENNATKI
jgi:hypothetical protein